MKRTKHGFTLVELIIVIAVIGVLAAILIPTFANVIDKANAKSALSDARNTVTQYITDAFENKSLPENIVVIVKKAGNYYLYGYNTRGDGSIQKARGGEAYKGLDSVKALFEAYSFNEKHAGQVPDSGRTDYEEATDGSFFLVPYDASGNPTVPVKGFHGTKAAEELPEETTYPTLNNKITDTVGEDTYIYHGVLLGGTYTLDSGNGGSNPTNTPAPTPKPKYTITFKAGNTHGNDAKVTLPNGGSVEVEEGSLFVPSTYSASYDHQASDEEWYVFDGWDPSDSFVVTGNAEVTATWVKYTATKYTLTFNATGGSLNLASGVTNGMQIITGTDITSYITGSSASKAEHTFKGWTDGENTYNSSSSGIVITKNITLDAIWQEIKYKMTIDNNNGDATYVLGSYAIGTGVTLPVAPTKSGYVFDYWKTSNTEDTTHYAATGSYSMPGKNVTITAVWKDKYTVQYYSFDGIKLDEKKVDAGTTITMPAEYTEYAKPDTDDIHYNFTGWTCNIDSAVYTGDYTVNSDVTFTAQYLDVPKFQVSFSAGELSGNANVSGIPSGFKAVPTTVVNPYEYGTPTYNWPGTGSKYTFDGWDPATVTMAEETVTFVAQWTELETYTVTFEKGEGANMTLGTLEDWTNGGSVDKGTDIAALVKGSTATPSGDADFIGWKCGAIVYDPATMASTGLAVTGNMTFTAQFNTHKYTVKYKAGAGSGSDYTQGEYALNENITLPTASACGFTAPKGKAFDKWQSSIDGEPTYGAGAPYTVSGNVTFTATWKSDSKTVTVKFYDTWNEQTIEGGTINVSGDSVNYSQAQGLAPDYWVQGSTTTVSITTDNTVTFNGDRHNTAVSGDTGTDYQVLTTLAGLKKVGNSSTTLTKNYWMLNDINNAGAKWESLGWLNEGDTAFTGKFDGNGKSVTNFTANYSNTETTYIGLFAINDGTVRNLKMYLSSSVMGYQRVGSVAGQNNGTIEHCYVSSDDWSISAQNTTSSGGAAGGIAGYNAGTINDCVTAVCQVFAYNYAGGIAGYNNASGVITNCTTYGGVNEAYTESAPYASIKLFYAGGIAGRNAGRIENCNVDLEPVDICGSKVVGGLVGQNDSTATLRNSNVLLNAQTVYGYCVVGGAVGYNNGGTISGVHVWFSSADAEVAASGSAEYTVGTSGSITGAYAGGLVGFTSGGTIELSGVGGPAGASIYSANTGDPSFYYWMVGGIAGANNGSTISQCWAYWPRLNRHTTATASGTIGCLQCVGGITGYNSGTVTNCFARNVEYTAYLYGAGLTGYNEGTVSYCWSYIKGYSTYNKTKSGDCVGLNDGGTLTSVYVYDRYNTNNTLGTSISGSPNSATALPSGFSTSVWELKSGFGPALIANPYAAVTIADGIMPEGLS